MQPTNEIPEAFRPVDLFGNPIPQASIAGTQSYLMDTRRTDAPTDDNARTARLRAAAMKDPPALLEAPARMADATSVQELKWLDQYEGEAYRYGMLYRPPTPGITCPREGYLLRLDSDWAAKHERYPHGQIWYSRELTAEEVDAYELRFIGSMRK